MRDRDPMHTTMRTMQTRRARAYGCGLPAALLLLVGLAVALPAQAGGRHEHHRWGGSGGWIERHAEELGLDEATLAEIGRILETSRGEAEAIYEEHRAARDVMHELLDQDEPDEAAVMRQAEAIGEIDVRKHKHRLATMLEIRAQLTPEQRDQLRALKREKMDDRRGKHCKHGDGGDCRHCEHGSDCKHGDAGDCKHCNKHCKHGGDCRHHDRRGGREDPAGSDEASQQAL